MWYGENKNNNNKKMELGERQEKQKRDVLSPRCQAEYNLVLLAL